MVDRVIKVTFDADISRLEQAYKKVGAGAQNVAKQTAAIDSSAKSSGGSLSGLAAKGLGLVGLGVIVKGVVGGTVDFQKSLNTLKAVGGATASQMAQVSKAAQDLGKDTSLAGQSAGTAAQAMTELVKGGLSVDQALKAARGTLELATAAQIDGAAAATIQANALNTFGLAADKAGHVADLLANAANKSSGEIEDFSAALAQGGLVAQGAGISIDDTVTALAEFAQAGLKGSDAGTSLKTSLLALQTPTEQQSGALETLGVKVYDAQGNFEGLRSLSEQLGKAQKGMSQEAFNSAAGIAFGSDAVRAAQVFAKNGEKGWDDYSKAMAETGSAAKLAAANTEGLPGALANLKNSAEGLALTVGTSLAPVLSTASEALSGLLGIVGDIPTPVLIATAAFIGLKKLGDSDMFGGFKRNMGLFRDAEKNVGGFRDAVRQVRIDADDAGKYVSKLGATAKVTGERFGGALKAIAGGAAFVGLGFVIDSLSQSFADGQAKVTDFSAAVDANTGALQINATQAAASALAASGAFDVISKLGISTETYTDAVLGNADGQKIVRDQLQQTMSQVHDLDSAYAATAGLKQFGADVRRVIDQERAGQQVQEALGDAQEAAKRQQDSYIDSLLRAHAAAIKNNYALQAVTVTTDKAVTAAAQLAAKNVLNASKQNILATANDATAIAVEKAQKAYDRAESTLTPMAAAAERAADAQSRLDESVGRIVTRLDKLAGRLPSVEDAMSDLNQATDDMAKAATNAEDGTNAFTGAIIKSTGEIDTGNQAGRDLRENLEGIRDKTVEAAKATFDHSRETKGLKASTVDATKVVKDARQAFIDTIAPMVGGTVQAGKLADAYGLIPEKVSTTIAADSKEAEAKAAKVKRLAEALDRLKALPTLDAADYASAKIQAVQDAMAAFKDKNVKLTIEQINLLQGVADAARIPSGVPGVSMNAAGGFITGPGSGTSDSIDARLSNGEFVVKASATAKNLPLLHAINQDKVGFASGGRVDIDMRAPSLSGSDATGLWRTMYAAADKGAAASKVEMAAAAAAFVGGVNAGLLGSQDPSAWGWTRGQGIEPYSYGGHPFLGGVAGGTQSLWNQLLGRVVPLIKGGLTGEQYGYENRDNVNSPGTPSFHSYGLAVDLNAAYNGNGTQPGSGLYQVPPATGAIARALGFLWGGEFSGTKDPMHLEMHRAKGGSGSAGTGDDGPAASGTMTRSAFHALAQSVAAAKGFHDPASAADIATNQAAQESSFRLNPPIPDDINAHNGSGGSQGILQFVRSTFERWKDPGFDKFLGAADQLHAFYNYVPGTYGSLDYLTRIGNGPYASGGRVTGPGSGTSDSAWARVSNGEFIVNSIAAGKNGPLLHAINSGFAAGGEVLLPGALGGRAPANYGERASAIRVGDSNLIAWIKDLGAQASQAADALAGATSSLHDARVSANQISHEQSQKVREVKRDNEQRLADAEKSLAHSRDSSSDRLDKARKREAKTDDQRAARAAAIAEAEKGLSAGAAKAEEKLAKIRRENAEKLEKATRAQDKANRAAGAEVTQLERTYTATVRRARVLGEESEATARALKQQAAHRAQLVAEGIAYDRATTAAAKTRDALTAARADRASQIGSLSGSIAGFGGGINGFADQRTTFASILRGRKSDLSANQAYDKTLAALRRNGLNLTDLTQIGDASDEGRSRASILARASRSQIAQLNQVTARNLAVSRHAAAGIVGAGTDANIAQLTRLVVTQNGQIDGMRREIATISGRISTGIRGGFHEMATESVRSRVAH